MSKLFVTVVAAALLAACSATPRYQRPDVDVPTAWSANASGIDASAGGTERAWWLRFDEAPLTALIDASLKDNFDLIAATERIEQARATTRVAEASLSPSLDLRASLARTRGKGADTQEVFLQAGYEADFWGRLRSAAKSADALATASSLDRDTVELTLAASITNTYFQVASLRERVRLARVIADNARRLLDLIQAQVAGGIASNLEFEQQRNAVATFDAAAAMLQQQLESALHALAVLVGRNPQDFAIADIDLALVNIPSARPGLPSTLLRQRPDIRSAEARLIAAHYDVASARAAYFPDLALTAQAGLAHPSLAHFFPATTVTSLALDLAQPLFQGGRLDGQLAFEQARERELVANYRRAIVVAFQDVEDTLSAIARLAEVEAADQTAVESARHAEELAEARFRYGTVNFVTVLDSERVRYQAEDALLQVRQQRLQAAVGLFRALGGGFGDGVAGAANGAAASSALASQP